MRRPTTLLLLAALAAGAAGAATACGDAAEREPGTESATADSLPADEGESPAGEARTSRSLQLASLGSRDAAEALRDSLAGAGWSAFVTEATVERAQRWRVHVLPTASAELLGFAEFALRQGRRDAFATSGLVPAAAGGPAVVRVHRVNHGTKGMARVLRWAHSPDHRALLAVDDPVSVEAEAIADGFLFATERGPVVVQVDSVWDVAPSPDWEWLAYGYAHLSRSGEQERPTDAEWADLARRAGLSVEETRRRAFSASGMAYVSAVAIPVVRRVGAGAGPGSERRIDVGGGWRAGWTTTGALAAFGTAPRSVQDDSPSPAYILVDPATGAARDSARSAAALARVPWVDGPTLDISLPFDIARRRSIEAGERTLLSEHGWVRVRTRGEAGPGRIVGPGALLAATATGRFLLVLVRDPAAGEYESPDLAVVYELDG